MKASQSLIITGMHRSHTSLVAHAFHEAGLFLGDDLIDAAPSNPYGHFESRQIVDFHLDVIRKEGLRNRWTFIKKEGAISASMTSAFASEAKEILCNHFDRTLFGWKDPRMPFFLNGWDSILTDAKYIFVVRHPMSCVASLDKRTLKHSKSIWHPFLSTRHFNLWDVTNECILEFVEAHPDRCVVIHAPDQLLESESAQRLNEIVKTEWGMPLQNIAFDKVIDNSLLKAKPHNSKLEKIYKRRSKTQDLYNTLIKKSQAYLM